MNNSCVIGIDVSTTALKAIAWSRQGQNLGEARVPLALQQPRPHYFEQRPGDWWLALCGALHELRQRLGTTTIEAIAIAHQRETVCAVDGSGEPLGPAMLWLDQRARDLVAPLVAAIGEERLRQLSGKAADFGPALYKIAWLQQCQPKLFGATHKFCDVQGWLVQRLTGRFATSWASADPFALLDIRKHAWAAELCQAAGVQPTQLCTVQAPGTPLGHICDSAATATGLAGGTPVIAAGGDGQAAGVGVNALTADRAYLNLGTAVVAGVYSAQAEMDAGWRTMIACAERGYVLESSLRSGALLSDWLLKRVCGIDPRGRPEALQAIEEAAAAVAPGSDGLLLLPYWEGAMNPYWDMRASGCIVGLTSAHDRAHLYRALIEGVALEQALVMQLIHQRSGLKPERFAAIGGVAQSDLWCQIMADVLDTEVERSECVEAASLGAAVCAASGAGWYDSVFDAAAAMQPAAHALFRPHPAMAQRYAELSQIYRTFYPGVRDLQRRLSAFGPS